MAEYISRYNPPKSEAYCYDPKAEKPFELSRSKIDLFMNCPRCFYLDCRIGVAQPPGFPFSLNSAVDELLKKEFDIAREKGKATAIMEEFGINAIPYKDKKMNEWRDALRGGIRYLHQPTNLLVKGGIDDIWINPQGELMIVDYKATSKKSEVNLDAEWQSGYKRQVEVYQWLFRKNGFKVSDTAYFVYCNGDTSKERFDAKLEFDIKIIPYKGNDSWIEPALLEIKACLDKNSLPETGDSCDYCKYIKALGQLKERHSKK